MDDRWDQAAEAVVDAWCRRMQIVEDYEALVASVSAALRDAYERGLRDGREAERADVVAWLRAWRLGKTRYLENIAEDLERAEHVPTPQGDEHGAQRASAADRLRRIAALYASWADGDEPEGAPSPRRTLLGIGEILADVPQGNEPGALVPLNEDSNSDSNRLARKTCATCRGAGRRAFMVIEGESEIEDCPDCAGESGGGR